MIEFDRPIPRVEDPDWARVADIPIHENAEPLTTLRLAPTLRVYPAYLHLGVPDAVTDCHVRTGVFERLLHASALLPEGYALVILDGWRPIAVQRHLYRALESTMSQHHPFADAETLERLTRQFVAPPSTAPHSPSPHLTGGAVDVTLCDEQGRLLHMGSRFDEVGPRSFTAYFEWAELVSAEDHNARQNRRLLHHAMTHAGFSNLSSEWWHYDYGNQLWAWHGGHEAAFYGPTELPRLEAQWHHQLAERFGITPP